MAYVIIAVQTVDDPVTGCRLDFAVTTHPTKPCALTITRDGTSRTMYFDLLGKYAGYAIDMPDNVVPLAPPH